jgi:hypothetical protein
MGLTGQEERACVHDSMRMGWGRGGGDDEGCHGRYITAAAKLMHPSMRSAHTLYSPPPTHTLIYRYIFICSRNSTHLVRLGRLSMPRLGDTLD